MPELINPDPRVHRSFLTAVAEFRAEGRGRAGDRTMLGDEIRRFARIWPDPVAFARYAARQRAMALEKTPRPEGFVPVTNLWLADGDEFLGRIAIRHSLTPILLEAGGHIGYDIRPSARRKGYATAMLREALPIAFDLGIDPALVTCDVDNIASRRVIERNGGVLEDQREQKLRFWVPTTP
jgi:predicted acetyltransferase